MIKFLQSLKKLKFSKEQILYSIGCHLVEGNDNPNLKKFLAEYRYKVIDIKNIPTREFDLLGSAYQFLSSKAERIERGTFYTKTDVAVDFVRDLDFSQGQIIFDPACGSGSFLFNSSAPAEQIFGVDIDPIAIMIAKFNYFIKFPDGRYPNLYCADFFEWCSENPDEKFGYIIGNPPYGIKIDLEKIPAEYVESGESFAYFIEFCYKLLKDDGIFRFLLPESILNVKRHADIRDFILEQTNLARIKRYAKRLSNVMSGLYMIELDKGKTRNVIFENSVSVAIPKRLYQESKNYIFVFLNEKDIVIMDKVKKLKQYDLSSSIFGLGVITGDNKTKLLKKWVKGAEAIYTGKEIVGKYNFLPAKNFIIYDRKTLQQVAPEEVYRASAKLVYKTISKYPKVVIDTTGALTTNSANILIPTIEKLDIYTVMAFLNSDLYAYLYSKMFGGVNKIAKENLVELPLPGVTKKQNAKIKDLAFEAVMTGDDEILQKYIHEEIFGLTEDEITYIRESISEGRE